ncbi:MAG: RidA family protein [Rhodospirillaceae bacterium]|nr:RidA family protein [Rhodospirillaceae bacterium]
MHKQKIWRIVEKHGVQSLMPTFIEVGKLPMKPPHLSAFQEAGPFIYLSGQLAFNAAGEICHPGVAEQTAQILSNIEGVLAKLGLSRTNIFKATVWLKPGSDFGAFNDSYATFFGEHRPARSTVYSELALSAAVVEIEAIAYRA